MSWFASSFAEVHDPRTGNAKRHDLLEVLTIARTASVCGAEHCSDFADFAADREDLFREFPRLENGIPSHDTFSRIFRLLDAEAFSTCFGAFVEALGEVGEGVVAIDGKTLRRSFDSATERSPLAVVTAFASATHMVLGQQGFRVGAGDSEIVAARALLQCLDLSGQLVTADATHCQNETAQVILDRGGDYLLRLKDNRPALAATVAEYFADPEVRAELPAAETADADHGRLEVRRARVSHDLSWLKGPRRAAGDLGRLPGLACLGMIEATVTRGGKTSTAPALSPVLAAAEPAGLSRCGPGALVDREQPALGPRHDLRRRPGPQPQGQRPGKPRHPQKARPQHAQTRQARHLHPPQTKAIRMVQRLRPNHPRPNAIALPAPPPGPLGISRRRCYVQS